MNSKLFFSAFKHKFVMNYYLITILNHARVKAFVRIKIVKNNKFSEKCKNSDDVLVVILWNIRKVDISLL